MLDHPAAGTGSMQLLRAVPVINFEVPSRLVKCYRPPSQLVDKCGWVSGGTASVTPLPKAGHCLGMLLRRRLLIPAAGSAGAAVVSLYLHGPVVAVATAALGLALLVAERRVGAISAAGRAVMLAALHLGAGLAMLVGLAGRRHQPAGGWYETPRWQTLSSDAGRPTTTTKRGGPQWLLTVLVVVVCDIVLGTSLPPPGLPAELDLGRSRLVTTNPELADIQRDSLTLTYEVSSSGTWRFAATSTPTINLGPSGRQTWAPPAPPQLRIAFTGGSAAFGFGQRDEHTIASQLARDLYEAGASAEVRNLGVPGWTLRNAVADVEARLARGERFDVLILYGGFNETVSAGLGAPPGTSLFDRLLTEELRRAREPESLAAAWRRSSALVQLSGWSPPPQPPPVRQMRPRKRTGFQLAPTDRDAALRALRFDFDEPARRAVQLGADYGFRVLTVYQPVALADGRDLLAAELLGPEFEAGELEELTRWHAEAPMLLQMVELRYADLLAGSDCYLDVVHHTESCVGPIAERLAEDLLEWLHGAQR